jgi:hypothetical protein
MGSFACFCLEGLMSSIKYLWMFDSMNSAPWNDPNNFHHPSAEAVRRYTDLKRDIERTWSSWLFSDRYLIFNLSWVT